MHPKLAGALLSALLLPACAAPVTPLPGTTKLLDDLPKVSNSPKSPCWQQKEIAAQNSYLGTIREKQETVYKAPCEVDKPAPKGEGKTKVAGG